MAGKEGVIRKRRKESDQPEGMSKADKKVYSGREGVLQEGCCPAGRNVFCRKEGVLMEGRCPTGK